MHRKSLEAAQHYNSNSNCSSADDQKDDDDQKDNDDREQPMKKRLLSLSQKFNNMSMLKHNTKGCLTNKLVVKPRTKNVFINLAVCSASVSFETFGGNGASSL